MIAKNSKPTPKSQFPAQEDFYLRKGRNNMSAPGS